MTSDTIPEANLTKTGAQENSSQALVPKITEVPKIRTKDAKDSPEIGEISTKSAESNTERANSSNKIAESNK